MKVKCQLGFVQSAKLNILADADKQHAQNAGHQRKNTQRKHKLDMNILTERSEKHVSSYYPFRDSNN